MTKEEREELERKAAEIAARHQPAPTLPTATSQPAPQPQKVVIVKTESVFLMFCWIAQIIACCIAALVFITTMTLPAPQAAAGMGAACAIVIIPYAFTRAIEGLLNR